MVTFSKSTLERKYELRRLMPYQFQPPVFWSNLSIIHSFYFSMVFPSLWKFLVFLLFAHPGKYEAFGYKDFTIGNPSGQISSCYVVSSHPGHHDQPGRGADGIGVRHDGILLPVCGQPRHLHWRVGAVQDGVSAIWRPQPMPCKMHASSKAVVGRVAFWVGQKTTWNIKFQVQDLNNEPFFPKVQRSLLWIRVMWGGAHYPTPGKSHQGTSGKSHQVSHITQL